VIPVTTPFQVWTRAAFMSAWLCAVGSSPAWAAETPLSLAEVVRLARDNSLAGQLVRANLRVNQAERAVTVASAFPTLSVSTQANYQQLPGAMGSGGGLGGFSQIVGFPATGSNMDTTISANQVIFDAFATRDALAIMDENIEATKLALVQAEQDAMFTASMSFFEVTRAEGLARVATEGVKQAQQHLQLGELRKKSGVGTHSEVLQLRAQLANAQGVMTQAQSAVNTARLNLSNAINASVGDRKLAPDANVPSVPVAKNVLDVVNRRPDVKQLAARQRAEEARASLESRATWPNVTLNSRYAQRNLNDGQFLAGLSVNWTVFDSFKVRNKVESAQNAAVASGIQLEQARQRAALDVRTQIQARQEAQARLKIAIEGLTAAQEAYRLSLKRFEVGMGTVFEVTDVQATLTQALQNHLQALGDQRLAELRLARALGYNLAELLLPSAIKTASQQ